MEPTSSTSGAVAGEVKALGERLVLFATILASVAIDLGFLVGWMYGLSYAHHWLDDIMTPSGTAPWLRVAAETVFDLSTLTVIVVYTVKDLIRSVRRIWRQP